MSWRIAAELREIFAEVAVTDGAQTWVGRSLNRKDQILSGLAEAVRALPEEVRSAAFSAPLTLRTDLERVTLREHWGSKIAFITTEGFENLLEMGSGERSELFTLRPQKKYDAIVAPELAFGVTERTRADGQVTRTLDEAEIAFLLSKLALTEVKTVAVCFLHARRNPANEKALQKILEEKGYRVVVSHDLVGNELVRAREVCARAYVIEAGEKLLEDVKALGFTGEIEITPPVSLTQQCGETSTGGTSTLTIDFLEDRILISVAGPDLSPSREIPISPLSKIGVDEGGLCFVGPEAVEAEPGPVSFGKGIQLCLLDLLLLKSALAPQGLPRLKYDLARVTRLVAPLSKQLRSDVMTTIDGFLILAGEAIAQHLVRSIDTVSPSAKVLLARGWVAPHFAPWVNQALGNSPLHLEVENEAPWRRALSLLDRANHTLPSTTPTVVVGDFTTSTAAHPEGTSPLAGTGATADPGDAGVPEVTRLVRRTGTSPVRASAAPSVAPKVAPLPDPFARAATRLRIAGIVHKLAAALREFHVQAALLNHEAEAVDIHGASPLHFLSFEAAVKAASQYLPPRLGETVVTNDPYVGNSRLCDLLLFQGVFGRDQARELRYFVALQITIPQLLHKPWPEVFKSIEEEGFRIPPSPLDERGVVNPALLEYLATSGMPAAELNVIFERAKKALQNAGQDILALEQKQGRKTLEKNLEGLSRYSETLMRRAIHEIPDGEYEATDSLEDDGVSKAALKIHCELSAQGENILLNFTGTSKQAAGPYNCNVTLTTAACFWFFRSLVKTPIPLNHGAFRAFSIEAPAGTLVNAKYPAPLLGGYFETTQRIVDVLEALLAKAIPTRARGQDGGSVTPTLLQFATRSLIETLADGAGADANRDGLSAHFTRLNNERPRSVEELEATYPLEITQHAQNKGSGGEGKHSGGDGVTRVYRFFEPVKVMPLGDRRVTKARGIFGGTNGSPFDISIAHGSEKRKPAPQKKLVGLNASDTLFLQSPGGGAWGKKEEEAAVPVEGDDEESSELS